MTDDGHSEYSQDVKFEPLEHPGHLVRRLHQICVSIFLSKSKEFDITHLQYAALQALEYSPGIDQARLVKLIATDRQTTSYVVRKLVEKGLVVNKMKNKKTSSLYLSGSARALMKIMEEIAPEIDDVILKPLNKSERAAFMQLLAKLVHKNNELSRAPFALGQ
jgi:DNA-binding MarR family transcriptional regulator